MTNEDIYEVLTSSAERQTHLPHWPDESVQKRFTGGTGRDLLKRTTVFVDALEKGGAFERADWKGLDFGCGWGRIASYLLSKGTADQLDLCDAWPESLSLAKQTGLANKMFQVSNVVRPGELPAGEYDFCYAMSIFTHLDRESFEANLRELASSLKAGGRLFFTVRHEGFMDKMMSLGRVPEGQKLDDDGFWHLTYPNRTNYGETAVRESFVQRVGSQYGEVSYLGLPEYEQHLYRITRSA